MKDSQKECFGLLDKVFPVGEEGLREVLPGCQQCADKLRCLKEALNTEKGFEFRSEVINRSREGGLWGSLKRWSERKNLDRRLKRKKGKGKCP